MEEMKYLQMHYKNKEFYPFLNEPLYTSFRGISFGRELKGGIFETSLQRVMQMGIHVKLQEFIDKQRYFERRYGTRLIEGSSTQFTLSGLKMSGSIQTLYYITCGLLGIGIIVFSLEIRLKILELFYWVYVAVIKFIHIPCWIHCAILVERSMRRGLLKLQLDIVNFIMMFNK